MIPIGGIRVISFSPPVPLSEQNMESLDLSSYPPAPVTWAYNALDTVCEPLGCGDWRQLAPESLTQKGAWLSEEFQLKAPVSELMPPLLTYPEYLQQTSSNYSLNSLKAFAFETPSTSLADVTTPSSHACFGLFGHHFAHNQGYFTASVCRLWKASGATHSWKGLGESKRGENR